jgi:hypothetical protein
VPGALSEGKKRPDREADHSPPPCAEVKNRWNYTSTPSIRLHVVLYLHMFIILNDAPLIQSVRCCYAFSYLERMMISKATCTHAHAYAHAPGCVHARTHQYARLLAFPRQHWFANAPLLRTLCVLLFINCRIELSCLFLNSLDVMDLLRIFFSVYSSQRFVSYLYLCHTGYLL